MVQAPDVDLLVKEAKRVEEIEKSGNRLMRDFETLSELSQSRVKDVATIPNQFEKGQVTVSAEIGRAHV